jgi:hypothetical protein
MFPWFVFLVLSVARLDSIGDGQIVGGQLSVISEFISGTGT